MMRHALLTIGMLTLLLVPAIAQAADEDVATTAPSKEEILRKNRELWENMTPEQRRHYVERLRRFQKMNPEERRRICEKAGKSIAKLPSQRREQFGNRKGRRDAHDAHRKMQEMLKRLCRRLPDDIKEGLAGLQEREQHALERYLLARIFEAHIKVALTSLTPAERKALAEISPDERHRYTRTVFSKYREKILAKMPEEARTKLAAMPKEKQRSAKHKYFKDALDKASVRIVAREVVPRLRALLALPESERLKKLEEAIGKYKGERRGPRGFRGFMRKSSEERKRLEGMTGEQRKKYFNDKTRRFLKSKGIPDEEIKGLLKLAPHERFRKLMELHPELFNGNRPPQDRGRGHGKGHKGKGPGGRGPRGERHPDGKPPR
jgi:Protein of unknown function (DUF3106)